MRRKYGSMKLQKKERLYRANASSSVI